MKILKQSYYQLNDIDDIIEYEFVFIYDYCKYRICINNHVKTRTERNMK